ncbi:hypothetical protein [Rhizobium ecuadorense]|uniref:hypothetical protein n=1 Tax=Rhizobium ecuadorense TaxID=1671795 RepID=UPI0006731C86|nr:hypothetical protein [Rhizobium ecuadorense]
MTLYALRLPKKAEFSPDKREQEQALAVYGKTGKIAMNDGHTDIYSLSLAAADGRASAAIV